eukprot:434700-Amorphochlora_amoeboformis.AAC.1
MTPTSLSITSLSRSPVPEFRHIGLNRGRNPFRATPKSRTRPARIWRSPRCAFDSIGQYRSLPVGNGNYRGSMPGLVGYAQAGALLSLISLILPVEGKGKACLAVSRSRVAFRPLDRLKLAGRTPRYARKVASHATQVSVRSSTPDESLFLNQAPPPPAWKDIDNMRYTSWAEKVDIQGSKV